MSLSEIIDVLHEAKGTGMDIFLKEDQLQYKIPKDKKIDESLLQRIKENRQPIIAFLKEQQGMQHRTGERENVSGIPGRKDTDLLPLSFAQERLWFIHQLEGSVPYHLPVTLRLAGKIDRAALAYAFQAIVDRHEVLRTVLEEHDDKVTQRIMSKGNWHLNTIDDPKYAADRTALEEQLAIFRDRPFDLKNDHMLRALLIGIGEEEYLLMVVIHHIASDGWSQSLIIKEMEELYNSFNEGRPSRLPPLPIQYADYSLWQRNYLTGEVLDRRLDYWKEQLQNVPPLNLPSDYPRPSIQSRRGAKKDFYLPAKLHEQLGSLSRGEGVTLFMTLLAAFEVLLYRYTDQPDFCVGSPIAGRQQEELEDLLGLFINTLALRSDIRDSTSFSTLLQKVRETTIKAYEHQDLPFEKIVELVVKERDLSRPPLFQVSFEWQDNIGTTAPSPGLNGIHLTQESLGHDTSLFDLTFTAIGQPQGIAIIVEYCKDLFTEKTITGMVAHYQQLLHSIVREPHQLIDALTMITPAEEQQIMEEFNDTQRYFPRDQTVVDIFRQQAKKTPDAIALEMAGSSMTYRQLDQRSDHLSEQLLRKGVGEDSLVPLCTRRDMDMIVAIWGILKAGGAYVPISPDYPADRIAYILEDTGAAIVVSDPGTRSVIPAQYQDRILEAGMSNAATAASRDDIRSGPAAHHLAYMIYTSGSTGNPKGVMIEHGGMLNHLYAKINELDITVNSRVAFTASITFDISVWQMLSALLCGGVTVLYNDQIRAHAAELLPRLENDTITIAEVVPSFLHPMPEKNTINLDRLEYLLLTGEPTTPALARNWLSAFTGTKLINAYGPTEASDDICHYLIKEKEILSTVPIGKPIQNTHIYITDKTGSLCPIGVYGEIEVSGIGVGRGYWKDPARTHDSFGMDRFPRDAGHRFYRTGDRGRWLPDGNIEFIGRVDDQLKIRGNRVEPGEVEALLLQSREVDQAVVVGRDDGHGQQRLVGYIVGKEGLDKERVLGYLRSRLPEYLVPSVLVELERLPLTANGKVDRKRLPEVGREDVIRRAYQAAGSRLEREVSLIWERLLGVEGIGMGDNFFELGGHSLLATRVVSAIRRELGRELTIRDLFSYPTVGSLSVYLSGMSQGDGLPALTRQERPARIPLSYAQERLWFIDRLEGSLQYHIPAVLRLSGNVNRAGLQAALRSIVNRHEVLRTVFQQEEGVAFQKVLDKDGWDWEPERAQPGHKENDSLQEYIKGLIGQPFDLSADHMLRAWLLEDKGEDGGAEQVLVVVLHHIASDGWSLPILVRELEELYRSFTAGRPAELPPIPLQYADYALWQRRYLEGDRLSGKLKYWTEQLKGVPVLELPEEGARAGIQGQRAGAVTLRIDRALTDRLQTLGHSQGSTLFMTLLAAFKVLLYRYSGQTDICVGSPVAGRQYQEVEGLIGFFINTLALRTGLEGNPGFTELLQRVRTTTLDAYDNQEVPFEKIVDAIGVERDRTRNPLFDVKFALHNIPDPGKLDLGDVRVSAVANGYLVGQIDISMDISESVQGLHASLTYRSDLYEEETIRRMSEHYGELLRAIAENPALPIDGFRLLTAAAERQLLIEFNDTGTDYRLDKTVVDLFGEQAASTPDAIALTCGEEELSYRELNERANRMGHYLRHRGVRTGTLVTLCVERGIEMIVTILGILKAGGAYVPVDPEYAEERIAYILEDCASGILVCDSTSLPKIRTKEDTILINLSLGSPAIREASSENMDASVSPDDLVYVIYTSGSTGNPKGVMIEHRGLTNLVYNQVEPLDLKPGIRVFQFSSVGFDASCHEIFCTLCVGGQLVLAAAGTLLDVSLLRNILERHRIQLITLPPSYQSAIKDHRFHVSTVISAGEALNIQLAAEMQEKGIRLVNAYGPTENTVSSILSGSPIHKSRCITIGKPLKNVSAYVLNANLDPVPIGMTGELYLGGVQVARGYLNNAELSAEKFVEDRFCKEYGGRMYRTGDRVRWLGDGSLVFLGRMDDQLKVRGFRIEPGEIAQTLQHSGLIGRCAVVGRRDASGMVQGLVAYVEAEGALDVEALLGYAREHLPSYMVPSWIVELENWPLTTSGKLDYRSLPSPEGIESAQKRKRYEKPRTDLHRQLSEIWSDLLETTPVGIHDNFFELGGHSLLAIRLVSRLRKELGVELPIGDLFDHPTIAELADRLEGVALGLQLPVIERGERPDHIPLSFSQERLWLIDQLEGSVAYHLPAVLQLRGKLDHEVLEASLRHIIERHEVLRTVFRQHDGKGYQQVQGSQDWRLNIRQAKKWQTDTLALEKYLRAEIARPFDLSKDYMLRAELLELAEGDYRLLVVMHHIVSDGWSESIIVREIKDLYQAGISGRPAQLKELPVQYADYAIWQRRYLQGDLLQEKMSYWKEQLQGVVPLELPVDHTRPAVQGTKGGMRRRQLEKGLLADLHALGRSEDTTLFMTLLAVFNILLYRYSGQKDICIGSPVAGRDRQEIEGLIGFFINTLALRTNLDGGPSFRTLLGRIRETALKGFAHQEAPFEKVVDLVVKERDLSRSPLFQVMFVLKNAAPGSMADKKTEEEPKDWDALAITEEPVGQETSKFEITWSVSESVSDLEVWAEYNSDLYDPETIDRMLLHYEKLLRSAVSDADRKISRLAMLLPEEEKQLLQEFRGPDADYDRHSTIVSLFEEQASRTPGSVAVIFGDEKWTYRELHERSNSLAHYLQQLGIKEGTLVPVCLERSFDMIVGLLGILKAGAAYVPIDPAYPKERIQFIMEDTAAKWALSSAACSPSLPETPGTEWVLIDSQWNEIGQRPAMTPWPQPGPQDLAYIIYTSGTTGQPKGVMIEHRNVTRLFRTDHPLFDFGQDDVWTLFHSFCFDFSVWEIFGALFYGGSLVIVPDLVTRDAILFVSLLQDKKVTILNQTPSAFYALQDCLAGKPEKLSLRTVIFGGESLDASALGPWRQLYPQCRLINMYGITETTVHVTCHPLDSQTADRRNKIGKPIPTLHVYIMDNDQNLVPVGTAGELYIGGDGLARGYLNRPELTAQRFPDDTFGLTGGLRLYRTGDAGRWLKKGHIEYLGRLDDQVKINGYRIELKEIEYCIASIPGVRRSRVLMVTGEGTGKKKLQAYLERQEEDLPDPGQPLTDPAAFIKRVREWLEKKLPAFMIPQKISLLDRFPLTANGKTDDKALREIEDDGPAPEKYIPPGNKKEEILAVIWQDLLGIEQVGIEDNFFELGGDSIISIQIISRVRQAGYELRAAQLFSYQTIAGLATVMEAIRPDRESLAEQGRLTGICGLTPIQQWYFQHAATDISHYNQSLLLGIDKKVEERILADAIRQLSAQHDALRFSYRDTAEGWQQHYGNDDAEFIVIDLQDTPGDILPGAITACTNSYQRSLNIQEGPLAVLIWIKTPAGDTHNRLFIAIHHLAMDGVSWRILLEDLELLLAAGEKEQEIDLGPKTSSFRQWYHALEEYGKNDNVTSLRQYWGKITQNYTPLPVDKDTGAPVTLKDTVNHRLKLDAEQTRQLLQDLSKAYRTEINDILLSALVRTFAEWRGIDKVVVGIEGHGRENIAEGVDISHTIGWFTTIYPVLLETGISEAPGDLIRNVKEQLRNIPDKGMSYGVLKYINKGSEGPDPWDIIFNYLGQSDNVAGGSNFFTRARESAGDNISPAHILKNKMAVSCVIQGGEFHVHWSCSSMHYEEATVVALAESYRANLQGLIAYCIGQARTGPVYSPSDFGLGSSISNKELDSFLLDGDDMDNIMEF